MTADFKRVIDFLKNDEQFNILLKEYEHRIYRLKICVDKFYYDEG